MNGKGEVKPVDLGYYSYAGNIIPKALHDVPLDKIMYFEMWSFQGYGTE